MNRRGFLQRLALVPVAAVLGDELFELLQPRATIILPPLAGWPVQIAKSFQVWSCSASDLGGYFYSRELSEVLRQSVAPLVRRLNQIEGGDYGCGNQTL